MADMKGNDQNGNTNDNFNAPSFSKILIPIDIDNPTLSTKLANYALRVTKLGEKETPEKDCSLIIMVYVIEDIKQGGAVGLQAKYGNVKLVEGFENSKEEAAKQLITQLKVNAEKKGVNIKGEIIFPQGRRIGKVLTGYIKQNDIDLVIIGAGDLFKLKYLLVGGSVTGFVIKHSSCPVLLVR